MVTNRQFRGRRSIRIQGFDYSQPAAYFLTICSADRECIFGRIENGQVQETCLGQIIRTCWIHIPDHFPTVDTDA